MLIGIEICSSWIESTLETDYAIGIFPRTKIL